MSGSMMHSRGCGAKPWSGMPPLQLSHWVMGSGSVFWRNPLRVGTDERVVRATRRRDPQLEPAYMTRLRLSSPRSSRWLHPPRAGATPPCSPAAFREMERGGRRMNQRSGSRNASRRSLTRWPAVWATVLTMGCEHGVDMVGELRVAGLPSQDGMRPQPAMIVVAAVMNDGMEFWSMPMPWCAAPDRKTTIVVRASSFGCAGPHMTTARVTAWVYSTDGPVDCAREQPEITSAWLVYPENARARVRSDSWPDVDPKPKRILEMATATVPVDLSWSLFPCRDASIPVSLTLVPVSGSPAQMAP